MERKVTEDSITYKFKCGIEASQEECSYSQDKDLLKILRKIKIDDVADLMKMKIADIISIIIDNDILPQVLNIILITGQPHGGYCWQDMKRSEIAQVIEDFFFLSPVLKKWLGTGKFAAALQPILNSAKTDSM